MSPETETLDLVLFETQTSVQVFTGNGMNAVLDQIEAKVREAAAGLDVSTADGRDKIRSVAYKVAKTKTALDAEGKRLTEEWRKNTAKVNEERRKSTERLEALAAEVRAPLTAFEEKEKKRVAAHEEALRDISGMLEMLQAYPDMAVGNLQQHLIDLSESNIGRDWEEFADRAAKTRRDVSVYLIGRIESRKKREAEQAELERLRREEADRLQRERDERLKAEAAEVARLKAERLANERAATERQRVAAEAERIRLETERQQREAEDRAAIARQNVERARLAAEERARLAEQERVAAEQRLADAKKKAADDAKKASEKAAQEREAALQKERDRVTAENVAARLAQRRREEDEANKARVRAEIVRDLVPFDGHDTASEIADFIIAGKLRNVQVVY